MNNKHLEGTGFDSLEHFAQTLLRKFEEMEPTPTVSKAMILVPFKKWKLLLRLSKLPEYSKMSQGDLNNFDLKEASKILDTELKKEVSKDLMEKYTQSIK